MFLIDGKIIVANTTGFLKRTFADAGKRNAVIAVSGGVDSATSLALTVRALAVDNVYPILLPYGTLNDDGVFHAQLVIASLHIPSQQIKKINIQSLVDPIIALDPSMNDVRRGNIMARVRMIVLFDLAKKLDALVVGTENKTEHLLGYFTRFGDEASDIEPIRNLYKTQVYELARFLNLPHGILTKKPTAGLWIGQTDEEEFGFSYKDADAILSLLYDKKKTVEDVVAAGFTKPIVDQVIDRVKKNAFKHDVPFVVK